MNSKYYEKYIEKLINSNPTDIIIKRKVKSDDGYGGSISETVIIEERIAFYDKKARREIVTDYGKSYTGISITKILARGNADILKNDVFTVDGVKYKVLFSETFFNICKQIELEVIE